MSQWKRKLPIMFLSDSIDIQSGLARLTRGLATRLASHPGFSVATLGLGGITSYNLMVRQYAIPTINPGTSWWGREAFAPAWYDAFGNSPGVVMGVWDLARLEWLPEHPLVKNGKVSIWGYNAIDGCGSDGKLLIKEAAVAKKLHRVAAYTDWAKQLILQERPNDNIQTLSHGLTSGLVHRRDDCPVERLYNKKLLLGVVMTNQIRKQWDLVASTFRELLDRDSRWHLWAHVDDMQRYWALEELFGVAGLLPSTSWTMTMSDQQMAALYSRCTVVLGAAPEGWGFPLAEAQLCGVPSLAIDCGGNKEIATRVFPVANWRAEAAYPVMRPICDPKVVADAIYKLMDEKLDPLDLRLKAMNKFSWDVVWPHWAQWFEAGL